MPRPIRRARRPRRARSLLSVAAVAGCVAALASLIGTPAQGAEIRWSGSLRVRAEGYEKTLLGRPAQWDFLQRTRLGAAIDIAPDVEALVQIQDARAWGRGANTLADTRNLDVHQAYASLTRSFESGSLRLRAGRQELSYGDERIVGVVAFDNVGRSFDGAQVRFARGALTADLVGARLADTSESAPSNDNLFLSYNRLVSSAGDRGFDAYAMYRATPAFGTTPTSAFETTLGQRLYGSRGRFRLEEEFALMLGSRGGNDIRAWLLTAQLYATIGSGWSVGAACDVLSGDDPSDATFQLFDVRRIFHTGHKFYGLMDVAEGYAGLAGLLDPRLVVGMPAPRGGKGRLEVHLFQVMESDQPQRVLGDPGPPGAGVGDSSLGTEVDLEVSIPVVASTRFEIGAGGFLPGTRLEEAGQDHAGYWGYLQGLVAF